jgi:vancomycin resistance protein YoaR
MKSSKKIKKVKKINKKKLKSVGKITFWFFIGAFITLFLVSGFSYIGFKTYFSEKVYPGISINNVDFSGQTEEQVKNYYLSKNMNISDASFVMIFEDKVATISASEVNFGYDENLLSTQALSLGRSENPLTNLNIIFHAYFDGINLSPAYKFSKETLNERLKPFYENINKEPIEAVFNFEEGRVREFKPSENGRTVDEDKLSEQILSKGKQIITTNGQKIIIIPVPTKVIEPTLTTEKVNEMGIKELIGSGTSLYQGSIESRAYNVGLGASRVNGVLVAPGENFSFVEAVGDVSSLTGYKQAYIISGGKTILGDGGGICQVSTTLFRAALNAGLPIVERYPHAYRVGYYEQDTPPGIDATVYVPSVDLKFKNDTGNHILIQSVNDPVEQKLTFMIYGTSDGRVAEVGTPVVTNVRPAPEPKFEDDPNLPAGEVKAG